MKAMVLAAGKGTRLAPLTDDLPKPLLPLADRPIIEYIFELLRDSGISETYVNAYHLADVLVGRYGWETSMGEMMINVSREERLMGTAGGVGRLRECFNETFVVIMGDALTDVDLPAVVDFHKECGATATLALTPVADTSRFGVVELSPKGDVLAFQEKPNPGEAISTLANTGVYVLEPEVLDYIPEDTFFDFAKDLFPRLLDAGVRFVGYEGSFYWSDVGTPSAYREAQQDLLWGRVRAQVPGERRNERLWVGRGALLHPTAEMGSHTVVGRDAIIGPAVTLAEDVTVGSGCRIAPGAHVESSILLPNSRVGAAAHVEGCIVGPGYEVPLGEVISGEVLVVLACASRAPTVLSGPSADGAS